jgi:hypothetical protein
MAKTRTVKLICKTADEAENIQRALDTPEVRAFLGVVGVLMPLGDRARTRVLAFVNDKLNEEAGKITIETTGSSHSGEASLELR